jgi:uncharacterized membrane protein YfcA
VSPIQEFNIFLFVLAGLCAELIDSSLGLAYGVTCSSLLLTFGFMPAIASSTTHYAEILLTLTSGISHFKIGNVDRKLFLELAVFGSLFAVVGAYMLSEVEIPYLKTLISIYLTLMGGVIVLRAFQKNIVFRRVNTKILASIGGFMDAIGGGGWGPIVTSTLIANGYDARKTIGSVNMAEFFITLTQSIIFLIFVGIKYPIAVLGIVIGGIPSAIIGAYITRRVNHKYLMFTVGLALIIINLSRWFRLG